MDRFETTEIVMKQNTQQRFGDECDVKIDEDEARLSCEYSSSARIKILFTRNARNVRTRLLPLSRSGETNHQRMCGRKYNFIYLPEVS